MKVHWITIDEVPKGGFGHGVEFHQKYKDGSFRLVAFLEGYEWLHGKPEEVTIVI